MLAGKNMSTFLVVHVNRPQYVPQGSMAWASFVRCVGSEEEVLSLAMNEEVVLTAAVDEWLAGEAQEGFRTKTPAISRAIVLGRLNKCTNKKANMNMTTLWSFSSFLIHVLVFHLTLDRNACGEPVCCTCWLERFIVGCQYGPFLAASTSLVGEWSVRRCGFVVNLCGAGAPCPGLRSGTTWSLCRELLKLSC